MRRDVFQAIADPTRRALIGLIAVGAMTPNAMADHFEVSRQAISKHLRILAACELVRQEQVGREIYYHLQPQKFKTVADFVEPFRQMWETKFDQLDSVLKQLRPKTK
jgi:DNA-binding transcriptional ArsR family regulator